MLRLLIFWTLIGRIIPSNICDSPTPEIYGLLKYPDRSHGTNCFFPHYKGEEATIDDGVQRLFNKAKAVKLCEEHNSSLLHLTNEDILKFFHEKLNDHPFHQNHLIPLGLIVTKEPINEVHVRWDNGQAQKINPRNVQMTSKAWDDVWTYWDPNGTIPPVHGYTTIKAHTSKNMIWASRDALPRHQYFRLFCHFNSSDPKFLPTTMIATSTATITTGTDIETSTEATESTQSKPSTVNECAGYNLYGTDDETSGAADWSIRFLSYCFAVAALLNGI